MQNSLKSRLALIIYLTQTEFKRRFAGSVGGSFWVFAGPFFTIVVIWVALDVGLNLRDTGGLDYGLNLIIGLCCWLFISEATNTSLESINGQPHLVKKVVFPVVLLPVTNVLTVFVVHIVILAFIVLVLIIRGREFDLIILTLPLWVIALVLLTTALSLLASALNVLLRDTRAIVPNIVSLMFWLTPIIWPISRLGEDWAFIWYLNPIAVIIEGYRSALLGTEGPLSPLGNVAFIVFLLLFSIMTIAVFRRLRPLFADNI